MVPGSARLRGTWLRQAEAKLWPLTYSHQGTWTEAADNRALSAGEKHPRLIDNNQDQSNFPIDFEKGRGMGGYGSGAGRSAARCDGMHSIDLAYLKQHRLLAPLTMGSLR